MTLNKEIIMKYVLVNDILKL